MLRISCKVFIEVIYYVYIYIYKWVYIISTKDTKQYCEIYLFIIIYLRLRKDIIWKEFDLK